MEQADGTAEPDALASESALLRSILETVPDAMIVIDHRGIVQSFSKAAERLAFSTFRGGDPHGLIPCQAAGPTDVVCAEKFLRQCVGFWWWR